MFVPPILMVDLLHQGKLPKASEISSLPENTNFCFLTSSVCVTAPPSVNRCIRYSLPGIPGKHGTYPNAITGITLLHFSPSPHELPHFQHKAGFCMHTPILGRAFHDLLSPIPYPQREHKILVS